MKSNQSPAFPPVFDRAASSGRRRRQLLGTAGAAAVTAKGLPCWAKAAAADDAEKTMLARPIPSSGESMPVVGLGSWITFNVGNDPRALANCTQVTRAFFAHCGRLNDCSPMYGSSQPAIDHALAQLGHPTALFSAQKVWQGVAVQGSAQMEMSRGH